MNDAFRAAQGLQSAGQQSFGYGQAIQNQQMQQGALQQQMMQDLINSGKGMFSGFVGQPAQNLNNLISTIFFFLGKLVSILFNNWITLSLTMTLSV